MTLTKSAALELTVAAGRELELARLNRINAKEDYGAAPTAENLARLNAAIAAERAAEVQLDMAQDLYEA